MGNIEKSEFSKAWDRWRYGTEGEQCVNYGSLSGERYLNNRLFLAFTAGWVEAEQRLIDKPAAK
jgi:hypothetical protein